MTQSGLAIAPCLREFPKTWARYGRRTQLVTFDETHTLLGLTTKLVLECGPLNGH